jgi:hypothetical protein
MPQPRRRIGCPAGVERRRHRSEAIEGEEEDARPDLILKYLDATFQQTSKDR